MSKNNLIEYFSQPPFNTFKWMRGFLQELKKPEIVIPNNNNEATQLELCMLFWKLLDKMTPAEYTRFLNDQTPETAQFISFCKSCGEDVSMQTAKTFTDFLTQILNNQPALSNKRSF